MTQPRPGRNDTHPAAVPPAAYPKRLPLAVTLDLLMSRWDVLAHVSGPQPEGVPGRHAPDGTRRLRLVIEGSV